jgi:hypothetical protein
LAISSRTSLVPTGGNQITIPVFGGGLRPFATLIALLSVAACGGGGTGEQASPSEAPVEDHTPPAERGTYLNFVAPSVVRTGEPQKVELRVITQAGLPQYDFEGAFRIEPSSPQVEFPKNVVMEPTKEGSLVLQGVKFEERGVQFLRGSVPGDTVQQLANPIVVMDDPEWNIYWGDLNGHSDLSSGVRSPGLYYWYAKSVALLDFVALTDNDHLADTDKVLDDETFRDLTEVVTEAHEPGRFVALSGFEWSSREYGNRLAFLSDTLSAVPSVRSGVDTPEKLRAALPTGSVIALPHPSGSKENPPTDPGAAGRGSEELVEIYSAVGLFETGSTPRASTLETPGAFVADLLQKGLRPGFIATSDTRLTTPGNPRGFPYGDLPYPGGLTAVLAKELTREAVLEALRARRCYATTGLRYLVEFTVDGSQMGSELSVPVGHRAEVYGSLGSTTNWMRVEVVGPNGPVATLTPETDASDVVEITYTTEATTEPTYLYLRGIDELGGMAWASPITLIPG